MLREKEIKGLSGWLMLAVLFAVLVFAVVLLVSAIRQVQVYSIILWLVVLVLSFVCLFGLTIVNPNEARVVQLFGRYKGSLKDQGFQWINPLTVRRKVSLRVRWAMPASRWEPPEASPARRRSAARL